MKITSITKIGDAISIILDNEESAMIYPFGKKDAYVTTSRHLYKYQLVEFKKDVLKYNFDVEKLKETWIEKKQ